MEELFLKLINMSITASYLVAAVLVLRFFLKKAPRYIYVILWGLVALRLIFPISLESIFSLIPNTEPLPEEFLYAATPQIQTGIPYVNNALNPVIAQSLTPAEFTSANPTQIWSFILSHIWVVGVVLMALYALISYLIVRRKVRASIRIGKNLRLCDSIDTPFILGILKPQIYLPSNLDPLAADHVLAHENAHLKRRDHWWKPLGFALLTVYWFNPVMWLAYVLLCRDIEMACDERVVRDLDVPGKKAYSEALLSCSAPRRLIAACPLAFGEVGVKERIKSVLNYKKPAFWVIAAAVILCIVVAVCFLTNPSGMLFTEVSGGVEGDALSITVISGETRYQITSKSGIDYVRQLLDELTVDKTEVSTSRTEDRDGYNTIVFHLKNTDTSYHFNRDCTEVWHHDAVKPTMTYNVKNSEIFLQFFNSGIEAPAESADWQEACWKVLADIQSRDSYHITENIMYDGEVIANDSYYAQYYKSGDTLLKLTQIPDQGFTTGYLRFNGIAYESNTNDGTLNWTEVSNISDYALTPWLYKFLWDDNKTDAIAMQNMGETYFIRLKVYEQIDDALLSADSYHVDFYFDNADNFLYAVQTVQGNITENGVDKPHTITSTMTVCDTPEADIRNPLEHIVLGGGVKQFSVGIPTTNLDFAITDAIIRNLYNYDKPEVNAYFESHIILSQMVGCGRANADPHEPCGFTQVCVVTLIEEALYRDGDLKIFETYLIPVVISFNEYSDGRLELTEFLYPEGDMTADQFMEEYFSSAALEKSRSIESYRDELEAECDKKMQMHLEMHG